MANDSTQLGMIVGTSAFINVVYAVKTGKDGVPPLVASGVMFAGLSTLSAITKRYELAIAFAMVFLLASSVAHGIPLIQSAVKLSTAKPWVAAKSDASSTKGGTKGGGTAGGGGGGGGGGGR